MNLPIDIILIIIKLLPIPDIRNLIRCDKKLNLLRFKNILSIININSLNWKNKLNFELTNSKYYKFLAPNSFKTIDLQDFSPIEKYTVEVICYGYIHLLPDKYILNNSVCLYAQIRLIAGYNNFLDFIKFYNKFRLYIYLFLDKFFRLSV